MIFACAHGRHPGERCWACGGAPTATVTDFTDEDVLRFVRPKLRDVARESLLSRMDCSHKAELILALTRK